MQSEVVVLPGDVERTILDLAARSDLLLFGELHGTREVPRLVGGLLPALGSLGYGGLALEVPSDQRQELAEWASGQTSQPPRFFTRPSGDGRASVEALGLIQQAATQDWPVLCFDQSATQSTKRWADRDHWMARNLLEQWLALCNGRRVVAVCGSLHARLARPEGVGGFLRKAINSGDEQWPSLANWVHQQQSTLAIATIEVRFAGGAYVNIGERTIYPRPGMGDKPFIASAEPAYTLELWLPRANPATFLSNPR